MSNIKASSELIHLVNEMHDDLTHMETVEIPEEFSICYISATWCLEQGERRGETSECTFSTRITPNIASAVEGTRLGRIFTPTMRKSPSRTWRTTWPWASNVPWYAPCLHSTRTYLVEGYGPWSMTSRTIASVKMRSNSSTRRHHAGETTKLLESVLLYKSTVQSWGLSTQQKGCTYEKR